MDSAALDDAPEGGLRAAAPSREPLAAAADLGVARLGDELVRAGYGEFLGCFDPLAPRPAKWRAHRACAPERLKPLVDLFLLEEPVEREALPAGIAELLPALTTAGLVAERADGSVSTAGVVVLLVFGNWLVCQAPQANPALYFGDDSVGLLTRLTPPTAGTVLDLCAGPGVHALHSARFSRQVTAVELDLRAAELARLNARLNRLTDKMEVLRGDLYAPVARRRFTAVSANPPMLPYPEGLPSPAIGHGGADGLQTTWRILGGLPNALEDGGCAQIVGLTLSDGVRPQPLERLAAVTRGDGLRIRCSVLSHTRLTTGGDLLERLVHTVSLISAESPAVVREAYGELLANAGADHLCTFYLQVTLGDPGLEVIDVAKPGGAGLWHV